MLAPNLMTLFGGTEMDQLACPCSSTDACRWLSGTEIRSVSMVMLTGRSDWAENSSLFSALSAILLTDRQPQGSCQNVIHHGMRRPALFP